MAIWGKGSVSECETQVFLSMWKII